MRTPIVAVPALISIILVLIFVAWAVMYVIIMIMMASARKYNALRKGQTRIVWKLVLLPTTLAGSTAWFGPKRVVQTVVEWRESDGWVRTCGLMWQDTNWWDELHPLSSLDSKRNNMLD